MEKRQRRWFENKMPLSLNEENRKAIQSLVEFAEKPENHYIPGKTSFVPGDRSEYVRYLDSYRCVFTITESQGKVFRHLSISVPAPNRLPHYITAFTIASMFGLTGAKTREDITLEPGPDWMFSPSENDHCVVIAQEIRI